MSNRLSKIYTRRGDQGTTSLGNGQRIAKTEPRIHLIGEVDELNSAIGLVISSLESSGPVAETLAGIQHQLFDLGGEVAIADPGYRVIEQSEIDFLESRLDQWNASLEPLQEFILPGGCIAASHCHMARCICRRAERHCLALAQQRDTDLSPLILAYLNRLSDLLFVASRLIVKQQGCQEILWRPKDKR
ncbi:cob(I)yrinic acid a,c-diamide adenosyltransferase [Neptuniibacter halophilus]|uniref:cob(I)yrinic acid a,c-diamide adenosyltransferase n=1 Tax=Neptuniibacter halophilus TaxID=651666 RepID=UPI00257338B3|nr:cob(I)yrinic acid a,c-diamide adenosyltransferase [Neptuniibacter halophilus]